MITNTAIDKTMPLGHYMATLSKAYIGVLLKRLEHNDVDRYYSIVLVLHQAREPYTQRTLGNVLNIDKVTMVRKIDHLMEAGIIERVNNPGDRREKFIMLTGKGKKAIKEIEEATAEINDRAMQGLSTTERQQLYSILERMNENLSDLPTKKIYLNFKRSKK